MPDYGSVEYWNNRYHCEREPFDWLFSYDDVKIIFDQLIESKNEEILMVGCGNAPLSPDMFKDGYKNLLNTDLSPVVIDIMKKEFPDQKWEVMDAMDTNFKSNSLKYIIDKSLIDTLMCAPESRTQLKKMMDEIFEF